MTVQELFIRANEELLKVVTHIKDDQWDMQLPETITWSPSSLKAAINYHAYDDAWVPDTLAGKTIAEVGDTYDFLYTVEDTVAAYTKYNARACDAVHALTRPHATVHLSYGDFEAEEYLRHIIAFRGLRVHDLAKLIGADSTIAPDLLQGMWDELSPRIESYRQMGVFPAALSVPIDADLQTKLLALTGREN